MKHRIRPENWRRHDIKKLVGFTAILASIAGAYFEKTGQVYDLFPPQESESGGFSVIAPDPWPETAASNLISIRGTSSAVSVGLVSNGKNLGSARVVDGRWEIRVKGNEAANRPLSLREYWGTWQTVHKVDRIALAENFGQERVTLDSPANGEQVDLGFVTFSGTSKPGVKVYVYVDGVVIGRTQAGKFGVWRAYKRMDTAGVRQIKAMELESGEETLVSNVQFGPAQ